MGKVESGLQVKGISKTYKSGAGVLKVLKKISFNALPTESVALTGPSGSGKSTLLSILGRLEEADGGEMNFTHTVINPWVLYFRSIFFCRNALLWKMYYCLLCPAGTPGY